jgi:two-component system OmpR family response regulator
MVSVGLCEDDPQVRRVVEEALAAVDLDVVVAHRAAEAIRAFTPDSGLRALVLDIGLPDGDGRDLCQALRASGVTAPVLFLTARGGVHEVVAGFGAGGDDYLVKPFAVAELQARVTALVRRAPAAVAAGASRALRLDPERYSVRHGDAEERLTPTEFRLLATLLARPGDVVRRRELIASAWPVGAVVQANTLDSYMRRIRRLLEEVHAEERLTTARGVGFRLG